MDRLGRLVDMAKSAKEMVQDAIAPAMVNESVYPYGLCISLTHDELEKLGMDADCEVGDVLHMHCFAKVTSVNKRDTGAGPECRIELQITHISAEDESEEDEAAEEEMDADEAPAASRGKVDLKKFYK